MGANAVNETRRTTKLGPIVAKTEELANWKKLDYKFLLENKFACRSIANR